MHANTGVNVNGVCRRRYKTLVLQADSQLSPASTGHKPMSLYFHFTVLLSNDRSPPKAIMDSAEKNTLSECELEELVTLFEEIDSLRSAYLLLVEVGSTLLRSR